MRRWIIVGAGRCGVQLTRAMLSHGIDVAALTSRSAESLERAGNVVPRKILLPWSAPLPACDAILIAVRDDAVEQCAGTLARRTPPEGGVALHTSGLLDRAALAPLAVKGWSAGSLHPLVGFPTITGPAISLDGIMAAVEGDDEAFRVADELAGRLGMRPHRLRGPEKGAYHAAAAIAGNLTHALVLIARETLEGIGFAPEEASAALSPLATGAIRSALESRGWEMLTGALARGDGETVARHLEALPGEIASAYRAIALALIPRLATEEGLSGARLEALVRALTPSN